MQTQKITLDFCQNDYKTVTVKQYDKDSRNLIITCTDNGAFYKLDSSTLQCNVKMNTPDDRAIYDTATINDDGTVLVTFSESMVYASGSGKLEIQFLDSSTKKSISTMILTVIIIGSVYPDDKIIASDEFNALTDALLKIESDVNDANEAIERINTLEEDVTTAEASRVAAEESRVLAESARVSAENTRVANENTRKTNETSRQTAESKRQTDTATAIANAEEATDRANEIAENCKDLMLGSGISITTTETTLEGSKDGLIKIESIAGVMEQDSTSGKNIFGFEKSAIDITAELRPNSGQRLTLSIVDGNPNKIKCNYTGGGYSTGYVIINGVDGTKDWAISYTVESNTTEYTPIVKKDKTHSNTECLILQFGGGNNGTNVAKDQYFVLSNIQVEAGTAATEYEPFTNGASPNPSYPMEIKKSVVSGVKTHHKNFLNPSLQTTTSNGVTCTRNSDGTYTLNGTASAKAVFQVFYNKDGAFKGKRIKGIGCPSGGSDASYKGWFTDVTVLGMNDFGNGAILTPSTNELKYIIEIASGYTCSNLVFKPMITTDLEDTYNDFEPYQGTEITFSQPIELYGMGDVQDVITPKEIKRRFGVVVLDGSDGEGWSLSGNGNNYYTYANNGAISTHSRVISTHFMGGSWNVNEKNLICLGNNQSPVLGISASSFASIAELKEFLASNEVKVVYELATETTEALPIADQIALKNLKSFDGITYILTDSEVKPIITTEYGTSKTSAHAIEALNKVYNAQIAISEIEEDINTLESDVDGLQSDVVELQNAITKTTETTIPNSYAGRLKIDEIGGVMEQDTTSGKNLAEPLLPTSTSKGVTCTNNGDGSFTLNGTATSGVTFRIDQSAYNGVDNLKAYNGTHTISLRDSNGNQNPSGLELFLTQHDTYTTYLNSNWKKTAEVNVDKCFIYINVAEGTALNNLKVYPQLEKGSVITEWEKFSGGQPAPNPSYPQEIKKSVVSGIRTHHKNFLKNEWENKLPTSENTNPLRARCKKVIPIRKGIAYTFSANDYTTYKYALNASRTIAYPFNVNEIHSLGNSADWLNKDFTFTALGDGYLSVVVSRVDNTNLSLEEVAKLKIQFEASPIATEYEPYTESAITFSQPIELYGIGDVQDVIENGMVNRKFKKIVFDGSTDEDWNRQAKGQFYIRLNTLVKKGTDGYYNSIMCDRYKVIPSHSHTLMEGICGYCDDNNSYPDLNWLYIVNPNLDTLEDLKAHLQANPITVVYELKAETTEALPIADQIALNSLATYDGITYVEFDSEIQPTFKAEYGTSKVGGYTLEGMLAGRNGELLAQSNADRIAALETSLVNNI